MDQLSNVKINGKNQANIAENTSFASAFSSTFDHLDEELNLLDLMLARAVYCFRTSRAGNEDLAASHPNFVSHKEVDYLLNTLPIEDSIASSTDEAIPSFNLAIEQQTQFIHSSIEISLSRSIHLPLVELAQTYALSALEMKILMVCLAPELRRKYDRIFAYLQDDLSRSRPSIDLVLQVLTDGEKARWQARSFLMSTAPLMMHQFLRVIPEPNACTGRSDLSSFLQLDERILGYILDNNSIDKRLQSVIEVMPCLQHYPPHLCSEGDKKHLENLLESSLTGEKRTAVWIELLGVQDTGKHCLARQLSERYSTTLLRINLASIPSLEGDFLTNLSLFCREALLLQAPVYMENFSALSQLSSQVDIKAAIRIIEESCWLVFTDETWSEEEGLPLERMNFLSISVGGQGLQQKRDQWNYYLKDLAFAGEDEAFTLARQYQLLPGQVDSAVRAARNLMLASPGETLGLKHLQAICKKESFRNLGKLATKVKAKHTWDDLVMQENDLAMLKSICQQVSNYYTVFDEWGFDKKISYGRGLSVLFSGKPGTGKTLAAQVIANEISLDLYKIDLSAVVSKYIGETEKNLERIFNDAEHSKVILFFDEADALFAKRSEVSDAHDRYANIETSYLLQKIEEYKGIVILASNYRKNMDEAFVRRIRFILEFPFPDQDKREQIWGKMIPSEMPLKGDINFRWLAENMKISGGSIKNIVLNSAFYAAEDGRPLAMSHLYQACHDEYRKIGRMWDESIMNFSDQGEGRP